jgi:hypothetical protein
MCVPIIISLTQHTKQVQTLQVLAAEAVGAQLVEDVASRYKELSWLQYLVSIPMLIPMFCDPNVDTPMRSRSCSRTYLRRPTTIRGGRWRSRAGFCSTWLTRAKRYVVVFVIRSSLLCDSQVTVCTYAFRYVQVESSVDPWNDGIPGDPDLLDWARKAGYLQWEEHAQDWTWWAKLEQLKRQFYLNEDHNYLNSARVGEAEHPVSV